MKRFLLPGVAAFCLWLFAWANDTGVLVRSTTEDLVGHHRVCYYFIGLSIERVVRGESFYARRCSLLWRLR
jgi:hypothetical protein